jgi:hypothetical protein
MFRKVDMCPTVLVDPQGVPIIKRILGSSGWFWLILLSGFFCNLSAQSMNHFTDKDEITISPAISGLTAVSMSNRTTTTDIMEKRYLFYATSSTIAALDTYDLSKQTKYSGSIQATSLIALYKTNSTPPLAEIYYINSSIIGLTEFNMESRSFQNTTTLVDLSSSSITDNTIKAFKKTPDEKYILALLGDFLLVIDTTTQDVVKLTYTQLDPTDEAERGVDLKTMITGIDSTYTNTNNLTIRDVSAKGTSLTILTNIRATYPTDAPNETVLYQTSIATPMLSPTRIYSENGYYGYNPLKIVTSPAGNQYILNGGDADSSEGYKDPTIYGLENQLTFSMNEFIDAILDYSLDITIEEVSDAMVIQENSQDILYLATVFSGDSTPYFIRFPLLSNVSAEQIDFYDMGESVAMNNTITAANGYLATIMDSSNSLSLWTTNPQIKITQALSRTSFTTNSDDTEAGQFSFSVNKDCKSVQVYLQMLGSTELDHQIWEQATLKANVSTTIDILPSDFQIDDETPDEGDYEIIIEAKSSSGTARQIIKTKVDNVPEVVKNISAAPGDQSLTIKWDELRAADIQEYRIFIKEGNSLSLSDLTESSTATSRMSPKSLTPRQMELSGGTSAEDTTMLSAEESLAQTGAFSGSAESLATEETSSPASDETAVTSAATTVESSVDNSPVIVESEAGSNAETSAELATVADLKSQFQASPAEGKFVVQDGIAMYLVAQPEDTTTSSDSTDTSASDSTTRQIKTMMRQVGWLAKTTQLALRVTSIAEDGQRLTNKQEYAILILAVDNGNKLSPDATLTTGIPAETYSASELAGDDGGCSSVRIPVAGADKPIQLWLSILSCMILCYIACKWSGTNKR